MIRRIIFIISLVLLGLIALLFYNRLNAKPERVLSNRVFDAIPSDASIVISSEKFFSLVSELNNQNLVWRSLVESDLFGNLKNGLTFIDSILEQDPALKASLNEIPVVVSYQMSGKNSVYPLISLELNGKLTAAKLSAFLKEHIPGAHTNRMYDNINITYVNDSNSFSGFYAFDNCFVWSASSMVLERSAREFSRKQGITSSEAFNKGIALRGENVLASVFVGAGSLKAMLPWITNQSLTENYLALVGDKGWLALDLALGSNVFSLVGFFSESDNSFLKTLYHQKPVKSTVLNRVPVGAKQLIAINLSKPDMFRQNYKGYLEEQGTEAAYSEWVQQTRNKTGIAPEDFAERIFTGELVKVYFEDNTDGAVENFILAGVKGKTMAEDALKDVVAFVEKESVHSPEKLVESILIDDELAFPVYNFPSPELFGQLYGPLFESAALKYFTFIENTLIAAHSKRALRQIVYANVLGKTLTRQSYFNDFYSQMSDEFNLLWYHDSRFFPETLQPVLDKTFYQSLFGNPDVFHNLNGLGLQLISSGEMPYVNMVADYSGQQKIEAETIWQSLLDTVFTMKPALVLNHYTKEREVFVQDVNNTVYLMSSSGRVLWKKKLDKQIISDIYQVDRYKNGKLQLLFNTQTKLWLLDRNGNSVERFPVSLSSSATTGLGLADYEGTRDYRIFVPVKDKRVLLYGVDGNRVKGWRFDKTDHEVNDPVQHIRVDAKDYILLADKLRVYILNRQGKERLSPDRQFSKQPGAAFYSEMNGPGGNPAILTADVNGNLVSILFSGKLLTQKLPVTSKEFKFIMSDLEGAGKLNAIVVDSNRVLVLNQLGEERFVRTFDHEINDNPNVYQFSGKDVKIGIVDRTDEDIYLINNDGSDKTGFPLPGKTPFSIGLLESGTGGFNLIVGGHDNFIYNYIVK